VFENFWQNYIFHAILIVTVFFQWVMVEVLSSFSQSVPLSLYEWIICVAIGAFSLPWGVLVRWVPVPEDAGRRKVAHSHSTTQYRDVLT
jgi:Ca2+-transporting ATPase